MNIPPKEFKPIFKLCKLCKISVRVCRTLTEIKVLLNFVGTKKAVLF